MSPAISVFSLTVALTPWILLRVLDELQKSRHKLNPEDYLVQWFQTIFGGASLLSKCNLMGNSKLYNRE